MGSRVSQSAWGDAWGDSWGYSWGAVSVAIPLVGGGIPEKYRKKKRVSEREHADHLRIDDDIILESIAKFLRDL